MRQALVSPALGSPISTQVGILPAGLLYLWQDRSFIQTFSREGLLRRKECPSRSGCLGGE